ncbi:MAG: SAM-dependent methyltransferase [Roseiarcus sp.]|uniref:SAM-dependent methyltransferase n=1 Tax=Roseiarcus sp. TaxID=1969460 RepID=UPI003BAFA328
MERAVQTLEPTYFDGIYATSPDPWRFASSAYELSKYALTLDALPRERYPRALEIGCSIGVLTQELASRCDSILAVDAAAAPLRAAKRRCARLKTVRFEQMFVPEQWPAGTFDLILLSEVVYYLDEEDVRRLASNVADATPPGADIVLVHWIGGTDYPLSGDEAANLFIAAMNGSCTLERSERHRRFRLDVLTRR